MTIITNEIYARALAECDRLRKLLGEALDSRAPPATRAEAEIGGAAKDNLLALAKDFARADHVELSCMSDGREPPYCLSDDDRLEVVRALEVTAAAATRVVALEAQIAAPFQSRVGEWTLACFGAEISTDRIERNHRFLEEALELVQANGCTEAEARQLVAYVYGRPQGDINQEVGGVMVTLAALCLANGEDMQAAAEKELARVWTKINQIRAKQAAKPKLS